jgi:hypothetical protein
MRQVIILSLLSFLVFGTACGSNAGPQPNVAPLTGNWQISLNRHASTTPLIFSGFLIQSKNSVTGSVVLGGGCQGVGPVTGTVDNQKLSMTINEFGQEVSLTGDVPSGSGGFLSGEFSTLPGGCTAFPNTGTWSARIVPPLSGQFHGTLSSFGGNGTISVTGNLVQGQNTGASNATLTGSIEVVNSQQFCSYLTTATISGVISGTNVTLNLFGPTGAQITQVNASITPDSTTLTGEGIVFSGISNTCLGDHGTLQITFP